MELPTTRHAANIVSLPSTATALLYKPWDVSAALLLLLARKPVVNSASDSHRTGSSALRSHLLAPFALHWIPAATARSPKTRPCRTVLACEGALVKAPGLSRRRPRMPALSLFVRRTSPPKSLLSKASARSRAALRTRPPRLHSLRTTVPRLATPSKSSRSSLLPKLDALILAARRLPVSKNPLPTSAAPNLAVLETSVPKTMTPRAFMRTHAVRRSDPLLNL